MTGTTIKVPAELRDRLNAAARQSGGTVADVIEDLISQRDRLERFRRMRAERAGMSQEERKAYQDEFLPWELVGLTTLAETDGS